MTNIGENIKKFRVFRKMTQVELGEAVGRSKNVVSNWEREWLKYAIFGVFPICAARWEIHRKDGKNVNLEHFLFHFCSKKKTGSI